MAITSSPVRGDTYSSSERITATVSFSEAVTVTGTPQLALAIGTQTRQADYSSGSGSSSLGFTYEVQYSDVDTDGISIAANALTLNGGAIRDSDTNNAALALGSYAIADASGHKVEGRISLFFVYAPQDGGDTYGVNELITVGVFFGDDLSFSPSTPGGTGSLQLELTIGSSARQINWALYPGTILNPLFFYYEVQSSDVDTDGLSIAAGALTVTGGTLTDSGGDPAHLNFGTHAVANDANRKVDGGVGDPPTVVSLGLNPNVPLVDRTFVADERIVALLSFGEPVAVTGAPQLALTVGGSTRQAIHVGCNGGVVGGFCSRALLFNYVVRGADVDTDGITVTANALALNGGAIRDRSGNNANLGLGAFALSAAAIGSHKVNGAVDRAPNLSWNVGYWSFVSGEEIRRPLVISRPQSSTTFGASETIEVFLFFNEPVVVTGAPQLALGIGAQTRQAGYQGCTIGDADPAGTCRRLAFAYAVQSSDSDPNGISIAAGALTLNGGTIRDLGGNNADLGLGTNAVSDSFRHKVDGSLDRAAPPGGGTPPAPPPPNRAPVAVGEFGGLDLDPGRSAEVSLSGRFRDPEGGALRYSAESLNPEVARAAVSGGRLRVEGRSPGLATVVVTATDSGGLSARLSLSVAVGRVLSFAQASASAPEGGAARLRVELSRPSERAVSVGYVLEPDGDPATADADAADHGGSDGTLTLAAGDTEAFIEVPINDDMDIEPAREHLRVRLLAPDSEADWALGAATASVAIEEGVCDRTPEVRDALRGSRECREPSVRDLAGRGYLSLYRRGIGSLRERDLLGLAGLRVLHLHGNGLAELPAGLFAGLGALERLRLDGNRLSELPAGLFAGLGRLSSLGLGGNRLRSLPGGLLSGLASLSRLDLGGNRLSELPAGLFEGASSLSELDLSGNPGAPFTLAMELVRTDAEDFAPGPAAVVARVAEGAPFALSAGLLAEGAALSADSARIGAGQVSGAPIAVSLSEGGAARLSLSGAPEVPSGLCGDVQDGQRPCFRGVRTEAGPGLLLFKRPPRVVRAVPGQAVESLGGALALDLSEFLAADGGGALAYSAESSDPALASVSVSGGVLSIEPNGEGLEGLLTVTVTATDGDGLAVEHRFTVAVSAAARPFARGWRLGWMAGAPVPAAEAAPQGAEPQ